MEILVHDVLCVGLPTPRFSQSAYPKDEGCVNWRIRRQSPCTLIAGTNNKLRTRKAHVQLVQQIEQERNDAHSVVAGVHREERENHKVECCGVQLNCDGFIKRLRSAVSTYAPQVDVEFSPKIQKLTIDLIAVLFHCAGSISLSINSPQLARTGQKQFHTPRQKQYAIGFLSLARPARYYMAGDMPRHTP